MKWSIDNSKIIAGDFNTPLSITDRTTNENKEINLNNNINQLDLTDTHRTFYPTTPKYILLKYTWNIPQDRLSSRQ